MQEEKKKLTKYWRHEAADVARQIIRKYYSSGVRFEFTEKNGDGLSNMC